MTGCSQLSTFTRGVSALKHLPQTLDTMDNRLKSVDNRLETLSNQNSFLMTVMSKNQQTENIVLENKATLIEINERLILLERKLYLIDRDKKGKNIRKKKEMTLFDKTLTKGAI